MSLGSPSCGRSSRGAVPPTQLQMWYAEKAIAFCLYNQAGPYLKAWSLRDPTLTVILQT